MSYLARVQAMYPVEVEEVDAGIMDKIKSVAKKSFLALVGLGIFEPSASAFTGTQLKTYAKEVSDIYKKAGIDCSVDAKVMKSGAKATATLTYKCSDGSASLIQITKIGENFKFLDTKLVKNDEGYVNPEIEQVSLSMAKEIQSLLDKANIDK